MSSCKEFAHILQYMLSCMSAYVIQWFVPILGSELHFLQTEKHGLEQIPSRRFLRSITPSFDRLRVIAQYLAWSVRTNLEKSL